MKYVYYSLLFLLAANSYAQFWVRTGGPAGDAIKSMAIGQNGDWYVVSKTLHRSTDHGHTWKLIGTKLPLRFEVGLGTVKLLAHPDNVLFLIIRTDLWKSTDGGDTWHKVLSWQSSGADPDIAISARGSVFISDGDSLHKSVDRGITWSVQRPIETWVGGEVFSDSTGSIYLNDDEAHGFLRSTDDGKTWHNIVDGLPSFGMVKIVTSPDKNSTLAATDGFLFRSVDSGRTWTEIPTLSHAYINSLLAKSVDTFFMCRGSLLERSTDAGVSWTLVEDLISSYFYNIFSFGDTLVVSLEGSLHKRHIRDDAWTEIPLHNGIVTRLALNKENRLYGASRKLWKINDTRTSWVIETSMNGKGYWHGYNVWELNIDSAGFYYCHVDFGFLNSANGKDWYYVSTFNNRLSYITAGKKPETLYVALAGVGIIRTTDKGLSWDTINSGLRSKFITTIGVGDGILYAGGRQEFYRSTDDGSSWSEPVFPFILGSRAMRAIATSPDLVVVGIEQTGAYFSSDKGITWENHSTGLGQDTINAILITSTRDVFAATTSGVYVFTRLAKEWKRLEPEMIKVACLSLAEDRDGYLYVGTDGDGVYRSSKSFSNVTVKPLIPPDIVLYPNPASTEINIKFRSGKSEKYRTVVYGLLGQSILTNTNEETVDVSSLHNGQYFLRVFTDDKIQTLPLSIVR